MQKKGMISTLISAAHGLPFSIVNYFKMYRSRGLRCNRRRHQWEVVSVALMGGLSTFSLWTPCRAHAWMHRTFGNMRNTGRMQKKQYHIGINDGSDELREENTMCTSLPLCFFSLSPPTNFFSGSQEAADYPSMHQAEGREVITGFQTHSADAHSYLRAI